MRTAVVKSITIERLFDIFTYHIQYPTDENVLIITGPNGFGKTQALNILFNLFNRNFDFFESLVFEKIVVRLDGDISIEIIKSLQATGEPEENATTSISFLFKRGDDIVETVDNAPKNTANDDRGILQELYHYFETDKEIKKVGIKNFIIKLNFSS